MELKDLKKWWVYINCLEKKVFKHWLTTRWLELITNFCWFIYHIQCIKESNDLTFWFIWLISSHFCNRILTILLLWWGFLGHFSRAVCNQTIYSSIPTRKGALCFQVVLSVWTFSLMHLHALDAICPKHAKESYWLRYTIFSVELHILD